MKESDLYDEFKKHNIDLYENRFSLGIDCYDCGDRFEYDGSNYVHIRKGDKDNGVVCDIYKTEEEFVVAMLNHMRLYNRSDSFKYKLFSELLNEASKDIYKEGD